MGPAAEDPRTATALATHQAGALRRLGGGVMAVVLGVVLGAAALDLAGNTGRLRITAIWRTRAVQRLDTLVGAHTLRG